MKKPIPLLTFFSQDSFRLKRSEDDRGLLWDVRVEVAYGQSGEYLFSIEAARPNHSIQASFQVPRNATIDEALIDAMTTAMDEGATSWTLYSIIARIEGAGATSTTTADGVILTFSLPYTCGSFEARIPWR